MMVGKCTVRQASECGMQYQLHPKDGTAAFVISGRILWCIHPNAWSVYRARLQVIFKVMLYAFNMRKA